MCCPYCSTVKKHAVRSIACYENVFYLEGL